MKNYFGSPLTNFENGVQLDLRVKLAIDFLKSQDFELRTSRPVTHGERERQVPATVGTSAMEQAQWALDLATSLLMEADRRGLIKEFSETDELSAPFRVHIRRSVRAQVYQQLQGAKIAQDEGGPQIGIAGPGSIPGLDGGRA